MLSMTVKKDTIKTPEEALIEIYRRMRPGDPPTLDSSRNLFEGMFLNAQKYDFSRVGRLKLNTKLGLGTPLTEKILHLEDIKAVIGFLLKLRRNPQDVDDIDHLGNRRVRSVGELLENQFRIGLVRMERAIKEKMSVYQEMATAMPHDLINAKPVMAVDPRVLRLQPAQPVHGPDEPALGDHPQAAALRPRTGRPQPRARRVRGARRAPHPLRPHLPDRDAGRPEHRPHLEPLLLRPHQRVRVHREPVPQGEGRPGPRLLPGPGVGRQRTTRWATSSSATRWSARTRRSPARKKKPAEIEPYCFYLSAWEEDKYTIAQANVRLDDDGDIMDERVEARKTGNFDPRQARGDRLRRRLAQAARLGGRLAHPVPRARRREPRPDGLEHAAPGRAPPPLARPRWWARAWSTSRSRTPGRRSCAAAAGVVDSVDSRRIIVRVEAQDGPDKGKEIGADIYNLTKFKCSNQNTSINQKPIVKVGPARGQGPDPGRRPLHRHGRAGPRPQRARGLHALARLQLRGRDPGQREAGQGGHVHLDPHRGVRDRGPRHQARARGRHPRHPERLGGAARTTSTRAASSASAPASSRATSWWARSRPRARPSSPPRRSCCARSSARRPATCATRRLVLPARHRGHRGRREDLLPEGRREGRPGQADRGRRAVHDGEEPEGRDPHPPGRARQAHRGPARRQDRDRRPRERRGRQGRQEGPDASPATCSRSCATPTS